MIEKPRYHINVFYSPRDECFVADVPDLKSCSAFGDTPAEAVREVEVAIDLYLESCERHGDPIPEPRYRPLIYQFAG